VYHNRGVSYYKKKDYDKAIADYSKAVDLNPQFAEAYYNRGVAYSVKKKFDACKEDLDKAMQLGYRYLRDY